MRSKVDLHPVCLRLAYFCTGFKSHFHVFPPILKSRPPSVLRKACLCPTCLTASFVNPEHEFQMSPEGSAALFEPVTVSCSITSLATYTYLLLKMYLRNFSFSPEISSTPSNWTYLFDFS